MHEMLNAEMSKQIRDL